MKQSHLTELIRTLTAEEKPQLLEFSALSFINAGRMRAHVVPFLQLCLNHFQNLAEGDQQELGAKEVFAVLFPGQEFVEGRLENLRVEAHKIVRRFLLEKHYSREDNEFQQTFDFSEIVRKRGLDARYQQLLIKLQKIQQATPWKNVPYFQRQFLLEYAIHEEACLHNQVKGDLNMPAVVHTVENQYHLICLVMLNRFLLQQKVAKIVVPEIIQNILEESAVPARCLEASPSIFVNFEIFGLLRKDILVPSDVRSLFDLLLFHENALDPESLREFYTYLRNLCVLIFKMDAQNEEINFILYELYKDNLARGYLHYEGRLHPTTYLGVCNNALWVKNYDWALAFIEKYKHELIDENETQDFYRLNMANYLFATGRFSECLDFIPGTSPSVTYLLQGKRLEIKARFELGEDLLSYKLDNFKMFISRTSPKLLSDAQRQIHVDFVNMLVQIAKSTPGDQKRSAQLVKRIKAKKQSAEWRWLLEKARGLGGGRAV